MLIDGPAGNLEAQWDETSDAKGTAILCHPHPLFGGSMHDGILQIASSVFNQCGISCLRFNFRGVGNSTGEHDKGRGEVEDLGAVMTWLAREKPDHKPWLMGYSFGANVVWQTLPGFSKEQLSGVLLIAPPVGRMNFSDNESLPTSVSAIAGDCDDFVDETAFRNWSGVDTQIIAGADHFFSGASTELGSLIRGVLEQKAD